jgi:uncharacterized protein (DUF488 family)
VLDVRTIPRSRSNPQYNFDVIAGELALDETGYARIPQLGGRRGRSRTIAPEVNAYWKNQSFHNYADYALSDEFERGLKQLIALAAASPAAVMCAEAVWWRCHRRIIADYLLLRGWRVIHLMGEARAEAATMTPAATEWKGRLVYPAAARGDE